MPLQGVHEGPTLRLRVAVVYSRLIERLMRRHRLARFVYAASDAISRVRALLLRGRARECPCCGGRFRRMGRRRLAQWDGVCPRCGSFSRHRAITLLLERLDLPGNRILHFAPEPLFDRVFERLELDRVTTDLHTPADLRLDIADIDLPDESFDLVLCSHVLEHVPDDRSAMRELHRVLADDGVALILTPYRPGERTYEDPSISDPLDRMVAFGQHDHVRVYGSDLGERLGRAGFAVEDTTLENLFDRETIERCELNAGEHLFLCRAGSRLGTQPRARIARSI
jgi:SAM-dependent methyltransferase